MRTAALSRKHISATKVGWAGHRRKGTRADRAQRSGTCGYDTAIRTDGPEATAAAVSLRQLEDYILSLQSTRAGCPCRGRVAAEERAQQGKEVLCMDTEDPQHKTRIKLQAGLLGNRPSINGHIGPRIMDRPRRARKKQSRRLATDLPQKSKIIIRPRALTAEARGGEIFAGPAWDHDDPGAAGPRSAHHSRCRSQSRLWAGGSTMRSEGKDRKEVMIALRKQ